MYTHSVKTFWKAAFVLVSVALFHSAAAAADAPDRFQVVDGVAIYLGVVPAQMIQGHPKEHLESEMHGGVPIKDHRDHVVVALFEDTTGKRIEDAQVTGSVMELGLAAQNKKFEAMEIADTITYGNYFDMPSKQTYHIKLRIRRPGKQDVEATFTHRHFKD